MSEALLQGSAPSCVAALTAIECERAGVWFVVTRSSTCFVCERHRRLIEIKLEREGLEPRMVRLAENPLSVVSG